MGMLFCTNKNDFTHEDHYDGKHFVFEPGVRVPLAVEAAEHMFGFRQADKSATLHRLGWSLRYDPSTKTFQDDPDALGKLSRFIFTEAVMTEKSSEPADETPVEPKRPTLTLKTLGRFDPKTGSHKSE